MHRKVLAVVLAALLVLTMNPVVEIGSSAWGAPPSNNQSTTAVDAPGRVDNASRQETLATPRAEEGQASESTTTPDESEGGAQDAPGESTGGNSQEEQPGSDGANAPTTPESTPETTPNTPEAPTTPPAPEAPEAEEPTLLVSWLEVAQAIEDGTLEGENFKPLKDATDKQGNPAYRISTPEAFAWWALLHADEPAVLGASIDLTRNGHAFPPNEEQPTTIGEESLWPGNTNLTAELDGKSHAVAFSTEGAGLFAKVTATGAVRWLYTGVSFAEREKHDQGDKTIQLGGVVTKGALAGSIAAVNEGEIRGVVNRLDISAQPKEEGTPAEAAHVGGLVGENNGVIRDSANLRSVTAGENAESVAAGIAAKGTGTIAQSYHAGNVISQASGAAIITDASKPDQYQTLVDETCAYLESATYENVSPEREGALTEADLKAADTRLNAGRAGDAAVWLAGTDEDTMAYPAPTTPLDGEGALPEKEAPPVEEEEPSNAIAEQQRSYESWSSVAMGVYFDLITESKTNPSGNVKIGGSGTKVDPFTIDTPEALAYLAYLVNADVTDSAGKRHGEANQYYKLTADIDLQGTGYIQAGESMSWNPIGVEGTKFFSSSMQGGLHTISNLTIPSDYQIWGIYRGLFGVIRVQPSSAITVDGLLFENATVDCGPGKVVGVLAGNVSSPQGGSAVLTRIGVKSGMVFGDKAGGLIGADFSSEGATRYKDCFNRAKVVATPYNSPVASGLVGMATSSQVFENCYYAGGLPKIDNALVGGSATVVNCYYENATVINTNGAKILPWDHALSVNLLNAGRTGIAAVWFSDMGNTNGGYPQFTRVTSWAQIGERVAKGEITQTASGKGSVKMGGSGSQPDPYTIDSPEALAYLSYLIRANKQDDTGKSHGQSGSYYKLTSDIDLSGEDYAGKNLRVDWAPIGANETTPFAASFDGSLKLITNLTISAESKGEGYDGLFGYVEKTMDVPSISRLHMSNVVLDRNSSEQAGAVAALVNNKSGSGPLIERVGVMGGSTIKGVCAGGLVGIDITAGIKASLYRDVFSRAQIYAAQDAGGILGYANTSQKFENVYYAGYGARYPIEGGKKANAYTNVYALPGSGLRPQGGAVVEKTAADMIDSDFVETLNASRVDSDAPWSVDFVEINEKYPHFGGFTYTSWGQVGMAVAKGFITTTQDGNGSVEIGGSGSKEDPFTIDSPEAFAYFSYKASTEGTLAGVYYKLTADIDLTGTGYATPGEKLEWLPIGSGRAFRSHFDGGFHTVSNLTALGQDPNVSVGLFGQLIPENNTSTSIENLYLTDVNVGRDDTSNAGALVGYLGDAALSTPPSITIAQIGVLSGTVKGITAGGVVGEGSAYDGRIKLSNCFSRASIQSSSYSGGIIGRGSCDQTIENSYFAGTGARYALDGSGKDGYTPTLFKNNYYKEGSAANGHSAGVSKMTETKMKERLFVNTLNGANASPWLFNVSGTNDGYPSFDWAVADWWDVGVAVAVGKITSSKTGPGKVTFSGGGTSSNPWTIETPEALAYLGYLVSKDGNEYANAGKYFKLTADLDLSGTQYTEDGSKLNWIPIGGSTTIVADMSSFRGNFDGGLCTISNLTIAENAKILTNAGLFGKVFSFAGNPVVIKDTYLKEVSLASNKIDTFLGPLAGDVQGDRSSITISRVGVVSGEVKGPFKMGGLVGRDYSNEGTVTYKDCFSRATLQQGSVRGGLIGYGYAKQTLSNCYFAGAGAENSILHEMRDGSYPNFDKCYFQSGSANRTQGESKTSTEMKQPAFALDLNDGRIADARAWYSDTAGKNDGYAAFDFSPSDWEDVGYGVSAGLITRTASGTGSVKWAGGNGTSGSPYLIDSPECLAYMSYLVKTQPSTYGDNTGVYYKLAADIDLKGSAYAGSGNTLDWLPISGFYKKGSDGMVADVKFRGKFNGDFYTVSNLTIVRQGYAQYDRVGMFGHLDGGALVQNMYLKDVNIQRSVMGAAGWSVAGPLAGMASGTYQNQEILVERVGVISGTVSVTAGSSSGSASGMVGTNGRAETGLIHFKDCFTRANVNCSVNSQNASGFINGDVWSPSRFTESYFAGSGAYYAFSSKYQDPHVRNNSYLNGSARVGQGVGRSVSQMKSSAFISTLNNNRTGAARPWYNDSKNKNSGFPLYDFEVGSWEDVGLGVDAGFIKETSTGSGSIKPTGSGTQSNPWLISSPEALAYVSYKVSIGYSEYVAAGKYFKLADDIDLAGEKYAGVGNKLNWLPIGSTNNKFKSNFDGDLHTISNLTIDDTSIYDYAGLFGLVRTSDIPLTMQKLYLDKVSINRDAAVRSGALMGDSNSDSASITISQVGVLSGTVKGKTAGGIMGGNGSNANTTHILDCFSKVTLTGSSYSGGIIGNSSWSTGQDIDNCYFAGSGALYAIDGSGKAPYFNNNYYQEGSATNGHSTGTTVKQESEMKQPAFANTLNNTGSTGSPWGVDYFGSNGVYKNDKYPLFSKTTWEMVGASVDSGVVTTPTTGTSVKFAGGTGAPADPYLIDSPEALAWLSFLVKNKMSDATGRYSTKSYKLAADIDLKGSKYATLATGSIDWLPIGEYSAAPFSGTFDGGMYTISNLIMANNSLLLGNMGLFGYLKGATAKNFYMSNVNLTNLVASTNSFSCVGPVAGMTDGTNSFSKIGVLSGTVITHQVGSAYATGGIIGWARSSATNSSAYTDCFSRATITQSSNSHASRGGLVGYSGVKQKYENCYFAGTGANYAIDGAAADKGNFNNSYYLQGSATNANVGVQPKTAGDLRDAGFPFTLNNGKFMGMTGLTSTVWAADADTQANWRNGGYPLFGNFYPTDWSMVGKAVDEGTIVGTGYKMTGRGTAADPYQIATPEALAQMSHLVKAQNSTYGVGKYYRVTADLDLKGLTYTENGAPLNWEPIGGYRLNPNVDWIFSGTFDGGLHTIDNLSITGNRSSLTSGDRERNGLFGAVTRPAEIKNIYLSNVVADRAVGAARQYAGSLIAYVDGTGTSGSVVLSQCGVLSGSLKATGTDSRTTVGGLIGMIDLGSSGAFVMKNCFSRADLSASNTLKRLSGLVGAHGAALSVTIENSYFAGSGANNALLGSPPNPATFVGCYYQDTSLAAGGEAQGVPKTADELKAWEIPFALNGNKFMGMRGVASTVWNRDALDAATQRNAGYPLFGNLYPENWGSIGQAVDEGSLVGNGFKIGETGKGTGTATDPYQISTPEALAHLSYLVKANKTTFADAGKWYTLTSDIDLTGSRYTADGSPLDWQPIGNSTSGSKISFDGSLHTIANLTISAKAPTDGRLGLFGGLVSHLGATDIKNIYLKNIDIAQENATYSGALAGYINNSSFPITVSQVGVISGIIKGQASGGLVGSMRGKSTKVENCFSRAKLEGLNTSGGIAGSSNDANISTPSTYSNCYFAGEGAQYAINGSNAGVFANSYYLENSATNGHAGVLPQTASSMKVWAFANTLNSTSNPAVWTTDTYTVLGDGSQLWRNGGFPLYGQLDALSWAEVGKRVQEGVIATPSAGTSVKPLNVNDADAGSVANPYQIDSPEALAWYSYCLANKIMGDTFHNASIELVADIDLAGTFYTGNSAMKMEWLPIGTSAPEASSYRGHFDGNFHTVSNLTKKEGHELFGQKYYEQGFFGQVDSATIENVALAKVELAAANNADSPLHAGALVARVGDGLYGAATRIERVAVEGGTIALSGSTSKVAAAGGLVGSVDYSPVQIRHSYSRTSLQNTATGAPYAGGLVGVTNYNGVQVESCYFAGSGATSALVGQSAAAAASTFVNGMYLDTALNVGGLDQGIKLTAGQLTSWGAAYQLNNGTEAVIDSKIWRKAHLVSDGQGNSVLENGGYPVLIGPGATGSNQHMDAAQNWAEVGEWVALFGGNGNRPADPTANRYIAAYPETLAWYATVLNSDSSYGDYKNKAIAFAKPLDFSGKKYSVTLTNQNPDPLAWSPVGDTAAHAFAGTVEGGGNAVINLRVVAGTSSVSSVSGLFGYAADGASFTGVIVGSRGGKMQDINGNEVIDYSAIEGNVAAGGIVGSAAGSTAAITFVDCENHAPITGKSTAAGGIMGMASVAGTTASFTRCANTGTVSSEVSAGGIAGNNAGTTTIKDCYNRGKVSAAANDASIGGLAGVKANGTLEVKYSYNAAALEAGTFTGVVAGELVGSAWTETANNNNAYDSSIYGLSMAQTNGAKGFTSAQMTDLGLKRAVEYLNAGRQPKANNPIDPAPWGAKATVNDKYPSFEDSLNMVTDSWLWVGYEQDLNDLYSTGALSGKGTDTDPYLFKTPEAFAWWNYSVNYNADAPATYVENGQTKTSAVTFSSSHARLGASLDMAGATYPASGGGNHSAGNPLKWTPIASLNGSVFTGTFNGKLEGDSTLYKITNLLATSEQGDNKDAALFGKVGMNGSLGFVTFGNNCKAISVGTGTTAAMLAVRLDTGAKAHDIVVEAGSSDPRYQNTVEGDSRAAGIAASLSADANVTRSSNEASVTAQTGTAGGIGADISGGTGFTVLTDVRNSGSVTTLGSGTSAAAAGIIAGLTGRTDVTSSYSTGKVGSASASITAPNRAGFAFPLWHGAADKTNLVHALYLENSAGLDNQVEAQGFKATDEDLKSWGAAYELNLRTVNGSLVNDVSQQKAWRMAKDAAENNGYPLLIVENDGNDQSMTAASDWNDVGRWSVVFGGSSVRPGVQDAGDSANKPIILSTDMHLAWLAYQVSNDNPSAPVWSHKFYSLGANIDLTGRVYTGKDDTKLNWSPLGATADRPFKGSLNGGGAIISSLSMQGASPSGGASEKLVGLFGAIEASPAMPSVHNLYLKNPNLNQTSDVPVYAGPLAGRVSGTAASVVLDCVGIISDAAQGGKVRIEGSADAAGGLVGCDESATANLLTYRNVFSRVAVEDAGSSGATGGLAGSTKEVQNFTNSYFAGMGVANALAGGAGVVDATSAANCYYLDSSLAAGGNAQGAQVRTLQEMDKWAFAYELNGSQFVGGGVASTPWTTDSVLPLINDHLPIFGNLAANTWEEVGRQVEAGVLTQPAAGGTSVKPTNIAEAGAGDSASKPYLIDSPEALAWFSYQVKNKPADFAYKHIALADNIDLRGSVYVGSTLRMEWLPIGGFYGGRDVWFTGTFDGNLNAIAGLTIQRPMTNGESAGLFGGVKAAPSGSAAMLQRAYFDDVLLKPVFGASDVGYAAPLAGRVSAVDGGVTVSRVGVRSMGAGPDAVVEPTGGQGFVSGLVGKTEGQPDTVLIEDSFSRAAFAANSGATGLVGAGSSGAIVTRSYFAGSQGESLAAATLDVGCWYADGSLLAGSAGTALSANELKGRVDIESVSVDWAPAGGTNVIDLLNTVPAADGTPVEYAAVDRRWFPTADSGSAAKNGGFPALTAPKQRFAKEVNPADAASGSIQVSLDGVTISAPTLLRNPRLVDIGRGNAPMEPSWELDAVQEVRNNHQLWQSGWSSDYTADKKMGLSLPQGGVAGDLSEGIGWTAPTAIDKLVVDIAAAYAYPSVRSASVMVADADGVLYEVAPTIQNKNSSTLDVTVQMQTNSDAFVLFPDSKVHTIEAGERAADGTITPEKSLIINNSPDVAVMGSIDRIVPLVGANLAPLPLTATPPVNNKGSLDNGSNVLLGMKFTDNTNVSSPVEVDEVYDPASSNPFMYFTLTGRESVSFQAYLTYSGFWQKGSARFGYSLNYSFLQPTGDLHPGEEAYLSATKASR